MTTHYIEEAERLADRVTIMSHGRAVAEGAPVELIAEHAGREVLEVYGPQARLREVEADVAGRGYATRRTGTSIAILGAENGVRAHDAPLPDGERRPANLEDVFVRLTGEEIA
jgi:lipooligosaccharide transport system ATP-binding protein